MNENSSTKVCFVIAPIGDEGSEVRLRSDQVLNHIIAPAAKECGYDTLRADKISEPGIITSQVIQHLIEDGLVIADLTGRNANVFYELAIRHAVRKPVVQVIKSGEPIPFDVSQSRTIQVDHRDLDSAARCKVDLVRQIRAAERNPGDADTPVSQAIDLQSLRSSTNPLEKSTAEILSLLQAVRSSIGELADMNRLPKFDSRIVEELMIQFERLRMCIEPGKDGKLNGDRLNEAQHYLRRTERILHGLALESGLGEGQIRDLSLRRGWRSNTPSGQ